jgi:hypothetical protein
MTYIWYDKNIQKIKEYIRIKTTNPKNNEFKTNIKTKTQEKKKKIKEKWFF